jgi:hypothetical protein
VYQKYTAKPEYSTKLDGTLAVVCIAAQEGIFEIMRYGKTTPPADLRKLWDIATDDNLSEEDKNKLIKEQYDERKDKKRKREDEVPEEEDAVMGEITELISASKVSQHAFLSCELLTLLLAEGKPSPQRKIQRGRQAFQEAQVQWTWTLQTVLQPSISPCAESTTTTTSSSSAFVHLSFGCGRISTVWP